MIDTLAQSATPPVQLANPVATPPGPASASAPADFRNLLVGFSGQEGLSTIPAETIEASLPAQVSGKLTDTVAPCLARMEAQSPQQGTALDTICAELLRMGGQAQIEAQVPVAEAVDKDAQPAALDTLALPAMPAQPLCATLPGGAVNTAHDTPQEMLNADAPDLPNGGPDIPAAPMTPVAIVLHPTQDAQPVPPSHSESHASAMPAPHVTTPLAEASSRMTTIVPGQEATLASDPVAPTPLPDPAGTKPDIAEPRSGNASPNLAAPALPNASAAPATAAPVFAPVPMTSPNWPAAVVAGPVVALLDAANNTMVLDIAPEELGKLTISLSVQGDVATVRFQAETPEAARLLAEAEKHLANDLARIGMSLAGHEATSDRRQSGARGGGRKSLGANPAPGPDPSPPRAVSVRLVNLLA